MDTEVTPEDLEVALDLMHLEREEPASLSPLFRPLVADLEALATFLAMEGDL